jgi:hypothetical protein
MEIRATQGWLFIDGLPHSKPFPKIKVTDLVTGEELRYCNYANTETGVARRLKVVNNILRTNKKLHPIILEVQTKLKIEITPCENPLCLCCRSFGVVDERPDTNAG